MSWLFSRALVEAFSAGTCSDGKPSALLNVTPTQHPFWHRDKTMDCWNRSQFGLTCAVLTEGRGAELLMSFRAAFHVRTSASEGVATGSMESAADSGWKWPASFVKWDRVTCSWRTRQCSLLGDSEEFSEIWPRWGSMRDGECWALATPGHLTNESASGLWPTPTAVTSSGGAALCKWGGSRSREKLRGMVTHKELNGPLNPEFPSWLMGWPIGWSSLTPLATDKFREWQQQHGAF